MDGTQRNDATDTSMQIYAQKWAEDLDIANMSEEHLLDVIRQAVLDGWNQGRQNSPERRVLELVAAASDDECLLTGNGTVFFPYRDVIEALGVEPGWSN
jgi:hypothetical protein